MERNEPGKPISVLIVDDQILFATSLRLVLENHVDGAFSVIGIAHNGAECIAMLRQSRPEVILMDIRMPDMDGIEATEIIHRDHPGIKIMILTTFDDDEYLKDALHSGATGYVLKSIDARDLATCIKAVHQGTLLVSPPVGFKIFGQPTDLAAKDRAVDGYQKKLNYLQTRFPNLKRREAEILYLLLQGKGNHQIAQELFIAEQTVRNYTSTIYTKIGVDDRFQAIQLLGQAR